MTQPSYARLPQAVDNRRGDTQRLMAQDLNSITRGYIWGFDVLTPQTVPDEWLHSHVVVAPFSIPANWGPVVTNGVSHYTGMDWHFQDAPSANMNWTLFHYHRADDTVTTLGHWYFRTDYGFSADTTDDKQIDFSARDVLIVQAPTVVEDELARATFTIWGK